MWRRCGIGCSDMAMLTIHILKPDMLTYSLCGRRIPGVNPLRPGRLPDNAMTIDESRADNLIGALPKNARICTQCYQYAGV